MALILSRTDLQRCLDMPAAIEAMRVAFRALHAGQVQVPQRVSVELAEHSLALLMPSLLQTPARPAFGLKLITLADANPARGLPRSFATVLVLDATSGQTLAIVEGGWLTAVRTGAVSGLATELLARKDADVLALFGAGTQARTQVWAIHTARPLREVRVVNRDDQHYAQLLHTLHQLLGDSCPPIVRAASAREALDGASLVACATASTTPLFNSRDIAPGTHINAIGAFTPEMCEVDAETLARARIVVDQREAALVEAGDLLQAHALGQIADSTSWLELGQLVSGEQPGRQSPDEVTCFKSVGLGIQDLVTALHVYERARELGVGVEVDI
jgi:ornithine cyclodeaminase/alanine dehydrogenase-like protein (mu-crystallin family)